MSASQVSPKRLIFDQLARVAKALSSTNRIELVEAMAQGERNVEELARLTGMSVANTSHHLQILRDNGLAASRKEGLQVFYRLSDDKIPMLLSCLSGVAERHLAEVQRIVREHFDGRDPLTPVSRSELMERVRQGEAMVIDVRPASEYAAGHIPGAVNIPVDELPAHLDQLPHDLVIVAYCRGPYCLMSFDAVQQLRQQGFNAQRLEEGFPEWKAEDLPIETNP